jgi:hypothetical protein
MHWETLTFNRNFLSAFENGVEGITNDMAMESWELKSTLEDFQGEMREHVFRKLQLSG